MTKIIGLIGLDGAGKDTATLAMQREFVQRGKACHIDGFAGPIRQISQRVGLETYDSEPYNRKKKETRLRMNADDFCASLQRASDEVLGQCLCDEDRASLYAYTVEALERFMDGGALALSPLEFMEVLGMEGGQRVRLTLWVELAQARWQGLNGIVLVPDTAFTHELAVLDDLILLYRPGRVLRKPRASDELALEMLNVHPGYCAGDLTIHGFRNDGSKAELERYAAEIASSIRLR